jgi:hypothetical protein
MKPGYEDVGIGPIILFGFHSLGNGSDLESASLGMIQDSAEHARGVEMGKTEPVDGPVHADQSGRLHVPDQAVIFNRLIGHRQKQGKQAI